MARFNPTPPHQPTEKNRRVVRLMAEHGIRQDTIARCLGISEKTLRKHYREELDVGLILATARIAEALYRRALDDNHPGSTTAAIFWLKCRAGWREPPREHARPIRHEPAAGKLSPEVQAALLNGVHRDREG